MWNRMSLAFLSGLVFGVVPALLIGQGTDEIVIEGVERELLLNSELSRFPGKQVTVFTGEFAPGAKTPMHRHPGTEIFYVLEGNGVMHIAGRESLQLSKGNALLVQPDPGTNSFVHQAINSSDSQKMKTLVVVIHDQGSPPAVPLDHPE